MKFPTWQVSTRLQHQSTFLIVFEDRCPSNKRTETFAHALEMLLDILQSLSQKTPANYQARTRQLAMFRRDDQWMLLRYYQASCEGMSLGLRKRFLHPEKLSLSGGNHTFQPSESILAHCSWGGWTNHAADSFTIPREGTSPRGDIGELVSLSASRCAINGTTIIRLSDDAFQNLQFLLMKHSGKA